MFSTLTVLLLSVAFCAYTYFRKKLNYWKERRVPSTNPWTPFGDVITGLLLGKSSHTYITHLFNKFKSAGHKFGGFYLTVGPMFIVVDQNLTKRMFGVDDDHFQARDTPEDGGKHILTDCVLMADAVTWRYLRDAMLKALSPAKVKKMYTVVEWYSDKLVSLLDSKKAGPVDMLDHAERYIMDLVCASYFGVEERTLVGRRSSMLNVLRFVNKINMWNFSKLVLRKGFTNLSPVLLSVVSDRYVETVCKKYAKTLLELRKRDPVKRDDVLNQMIQLLEDKNEPMNYRQFVAQVLQYLSGSVDTTSLSTTYVCYELAKSPEIQENLRSKLKSAIEKNDGMLDYDVISNLEYLDRIVKETVRLHPLFVFSYRKCTKDYKIPDTDIVLEKGISVVIPFAAMHRDEELFPDAKNFNPDRFLDSKQASVFMGFGCGQRFCVGKHLALLMVKMVIAKMVLNFRMTVNEKTGPMLKPPRFTTHLLWHYKNKILLDLEKI